MRTLIGAVLGFVLAAALIAALAAKAGIQDYWTILPAGLLAGLGMRSIAASQHRSYARGALAALATVLGMIGGQMVAAEWIRSDRPQAAQRAAADVKEDAEQVATEGEAAPAEAPVATAEEAPTAPAGAIGAPRKGDVKPLDAVFLALGCLLAYQVGKGPDTTVSDEAEGASAVPGGDGSVPREPAGGLPGGDI